MSHGARSMTGNHDLLPANNKNIARSIPNVPVHDLSSWTFGGGTVIWRIWPAVLLHTGFAAAIVAVSKNTKVNLGVPNVLITLLGVVIGFVISLRVSSAYDRYWWGRCAWSDIVKTTRTMSRLIWINTPARINKSATSSEVSSEEIGQAMREKRVALELLEAFSVSLKHHLRGELGIYYDDLYHIVRPLHEHHKNLHATETHPPPQQRNGKAQDHTTTIESPTTTPGNPVIPAINEYGSFRALGPRHKHSYASLISTDSSEGEREPLLPSALPGPRYGASVDLIPFTSVLSNLGYYLNVRRWIRRWRAKWREGFEGSDEDGGVGIRWNESQNQQGRSTSANTGNQGILRHRRATRQTHKTPGKHRPRVAGDGENLPLEVLRTLGQWLSVLEERGTVGGNTLGGMFACVTAFEDALSTLERILTTPLPFVYSVHIRHTVWLYLFFLPFQLVRDFNWYTIPGTAVAAFFYLGFVAAGEEIEQPFGYDENDLDLDLFCRELVKADLRTLTLTPFPNAPMGSHHVDGEMYDSTTIVEISRGRARD